MTDFSTTEFSEFVIDEHIIGIRTTDLTLKSGRRSPHYVNWRTLANDVYLLDNLTDYVLQFIAQLPLECDCFYGVPEGATKLGVVTQFKWARRRADYGAGAYRLPMGRAKAKEHGDAADRYFVGAPEGRIVLLEDTTTTGGSMLQAAAFLQDLGVDIVAAVGLTNRNEKRDDGLTVAEAAAAQGIQYYAMSNALDLLPIMRRRDLIPAERIPALEAYYEQYGEQPLQW